MLIIMQYFLLNTVVFNINYLSMCIIIFLEFVCPHNASSKTLFSDGTINRRIIASLSHLRSQPCAKYSDPFNSQWRKSSPTLHNMEEKKKLPFNADLPYTNKLDVC